MGESLDIPALAQMLDHFGRMVEGAIQRWRDVPLPNAAKNDGAMVLVLHLANTYLAKCRADPRTIHSREPERYGGDFFYFADTVLSALGCHQQNLARGKMIDRTLRRLYVPAKTREEWARSAARVNNFSSVLDQ
jgi:hypothetical protein